MNDIGKGVAAIIIERLVSKFGDWLWEKVIKKKAENGESVEQDRETNSEPSEEQDS